MLAVIDRYLALPKEEKLLFRLGRRGGALRSLDELDDPVMRQRLQAAMRHLWSETGGDVEKIITESRISIFSWHLAYVGLTIRQELGF